MLVCYGSQACVDNRHRRNQLVIEMFFEVLICLQGYFDILFGSITEENMQGYLLSSKIIEGLIIMEDSERSCILFDINYLLCKN